MQGGVDGIVLGGWVEFEGVCAVGQVGAGREH